MSDEAPKPTVTGRMRALTDADLDPWQTHQRGVREGAKAGALRELVRTLNQTVERVERQADALTTMQAVEDKRLTELEKDMSSTQLTLKEALHETRVDNRQTREMLATLTGGVAALKWIMPIIISVAVGLASAVTYIVSHAK